VAAIAENSIILGASDRMLTAGDIQFEPGDIKIRRLTTSIAILTAGDSDLHAEILQSVFSEVRAIDLDDSWEIKEIAEMYAKYYGEVRSKRAERAYLSPLRLTMDEFLDRQQSMDSDTVARLTTEIINFDAGCAQAIVAGIDSTGPHLWVVDNESVSCHDRVGFAAIGAGEWHAKSQFMFAGYGRFISVPRAMRITYGAKKRAEVAPGVGNATDMFYIGPDLGSFTWFRSNITNKLEEIYQRLRTQEEEAAETANMEMHEYAEELEKHAQAAAEAAALAEQEASSANDLGGSPSDQKQLQAGSDEKQSEDEEQEN
jgi:hypothetical protein